MAEKTKEQANAVSEAVVSSVNTVANKTVEEAENIVVTTGVVRKVSLVHVLFLGSPAIGGNSALVNTRVNSTRHCLTLQTVPTVCWGDLVSLYLFISGIPITLQEWGLGIHFMHKESDMQTMASPIPLACRKYISQGQCMVTG